MAYKTIKYEKEDNICIVTLNRPEALNALSAQMESEIAQAVDEITKDSEIHAFILTGAPRPDGRPCFCSGWHIGEKVPSGTPVVNTPLTTVQKMVTGDRGETRGSYYDKIEWCPKISIAAIDGVCTTAGLAVALSCDIMVVSETAAISELIVKNLAEIGFSGTVPMLALRVGVAKAIEICCTGEPIDGKEAYRIGLANQLFAPDKLLPGAKELAKKMATMRPSALAMVKFVGKATYSMDYRTLWRFNEVCNAILWASPDDTEWATRRWRPRR